MFHISQRWVSFYVSFVQYAEKMTETGFDKIPFF